MDENKLKELFNNKNVKIVNHKLLELYNSKKEVIDKISKAFENNKVINPTTGKEMTLVFHSSCIPHNYKEMTHKILIVGQETNGWVFKENAKESMLFTLGFLYSPQHNDKPSFTFPFEFCKSINNYNYDENYIKTYFAWVSLRKFAYNENHGESLNKEAQDIIDSEFNILEEEIRIIKPEIVLFLTGPTDKYEKLLQNELNGIKYNEIKNSNYTKRKFARLEHKSLPKNSFRIYNTSYLVRNKLQNEYLQELVKECKLYLN